MGNDFYFYFSIYLSIFEQEKGGGGEKGKAQVQVHLLWMEKLEERIKGKGTKIRLDICSGFYAVKTPNIRK